MVKKKQKAQVILNRLPELFVLKPWLELLELTIDASILDNNAL